MTEIEYVKKVFKPENLAQINKSREKIKYIEGQIEIILTDLESTAKIDQLEMIEKSVAGFV